MHYSFVVDLSEIPTTSTTWFH